MDMQGAADRADGMLSATVKAVVPEIQWTFDTTTTGSCDVTRYWTVMTVISDQRRGNFLGVVERFWTQSDYKIKSVNRSKRTPAIYAVSPDGFGISLVFGDKGQAFFEVTSPCVSKSEVAPPKTLSNGPAYNDVDIPYPNVRSDFWSAETPVSSPAASP
ncbi:hypothetical protein Q5762_15435 [Streptomyces sp. P9(2023)]|uniref:hypothetical protein n=1 Tax=Streptomyces sp. P9(2023) TaxID=3064394 RepID=UPI0028F4170A|nr:hypothetical protein [Streptomyces sp. P9(2023)]MDT9689705.1 hypothetical protein [Streptomyces sp. P9(2023)]